MLFDIRTSTSATNTLQDLLGSSYDDFIRDYFCSNNDRKHLFYEKWASQINSSALGSLQYVVMHITTNSNNCIEIKTNGLKNLRLILSENTLLCRELKNIGVIFDTTNKTLTYDNHMFSIDLEDCRNKKDDSKLDKLLWDISRRVYNDEGICGFFSCNDITKYGTNIHKRPEFLETLCMLFPKLRPLERAWIDKSKTYIILFSAELSQFEYYTFFRYDNHNVIEQQRKELANWILSNAVERSLEKGSSSKIAYINKNITIPSAQIIDILKFNYN